jgi:starvation-inducible DNA-binding protein
MQEYLRNSEIKEAATNHPSEIMVRELLNDYRILIQYLEAVIGIASEQNDVGTENMIKTYIRKIEKHHWMLSAFLAK